MEVHHHPQIEKKGFKEYFLEFVMIFLAVTLGFFAESLREHFANVRITRQYLEAYQQELEHNKETMHRYDSSYTSLMKETDSMAMLFYNRKENEDLNATSRLFTKSRAIVPTTLDDAAYQQLINSGGLKFIHNKALRDSMARYASSMKEFSVYNQIKYADRSANIPEMNSLDDIYDWTSSTKIPEMDPYPKLTERERRFIVSFYRQVYIQLASDKIGLSRLNSVNTNLIKMVQDELNK